LRKYKAESTDEYLSIW